MSDSGSSVIRSQLEGSLTVSPEPNKKTHLNAGSKSNGEGTSSSLPDFEGASSTSMLSDLYILDCRGPVAATGNSLQGKGVENIRYYTNATLK